jgi:hypothetical protein
MLLLCDLPRWLQDKEVTRVLPLLTACTQRVKLLPQLHFLSSFRRAPILLATVILTAETDHIHLYQPEIAGLAVGGRQVSMFDDLNPVS